MVAASFACWVVPPPGSVPAIAVLKTRLLPESFPLPGNSRLVTNLCHSTRRGAVLSAKPATTHHDCCTDVARIDLRRIVERHLYRQWPGQALGPGGLPGRTAAHCQPFVAGVPDAQQQVRVNYADKQVGTLQHFWQHAVPKRQRVHGSRFNLTFRHIAPG